MTDAKLPIEYSIEDPEDPGPYGDSHYHLQLTRATEYSAAFDLKARTEFILKPGDVKLIPTGIFLHFTDSQYCAVVLPRSGLAVKSGVTVINSPGLIDPDYTGEIMVGLHMVQMTRSQPHLPMAFEKYSRIAQLLVLPVPDIELVLGAGTTTPLGTRGDGGFGSTGL